MILKTYKFTRLINISGLVLFLNLRIGHMISEVSLECGSWNFNSSDPAHSHAPWSAFLIGTNASKVIPALLVSPSLLLISVNNFAKGTEIKSVPPFETYSAVVGSQKWGAEDENSVTMKVSHMSMDPSVKSRPAASLKNVVVLVYLDAPLTLTTRIKPICLPDTEMFEATQLTDKTAPNTFNLVGWAKNGTVQLNMKLRLLNYWTCMFSWILPGIVLPYDDTFCATVDEGMENCIYWGVGPAQLINGSSYYSMGQINNNKPMESCGPRKKYFFEVWRRETLSWLRTSESCNLTEFSCGDGTCLSKDKLCNRQVECLNGIDENVQLCERNFKCGVGEVFCGRNSEPRCISSDRLNVGRNACDGGQDVTIKDTFDETSEVTRKPKFDFILVSIVLVVGTIAAVVYIIARYISRQMTILDEPSKTSALTDVESDSDLQPIEFSAEFTSPLSEQTIPSPWKSISSLICKGTIGKGSFAKVYKAIDTKDFHECAGFAIKCVDIPKAVATFRSFSAASVQGFGAHQLSNLATEIDILDKLSCDNIIRYYGCWAEAADCKTAPLDRSRLISYLSQDHWLQSASSTYEFPMSYIFIRMELCDSTLQNLLELGHIGRTGFEFEHIMKQIVAGLKYLHGKKIIHRDLKPSNIFCKMEATGGAVWKLGDFGLATRQSDQPGGNMAVVGTKIYSSPEMLADLGYTTQTDMYSLGLILAEMSHNHGTWSKGGRFNLFNKLRNLGDKERHKEIDRHTKDNCKSFVEAINSLLKTRPSLRLTCEALDLRITQIMHVRMEPM
ncbi:uncharacterized protein LOC110857826 [Folsomia candida]|uniref:uncharacterized protein LOC110857826 n=1 Tax=Folsomia candida TaxID=158441 RepID=UPI001604BD7C|nr:uncharacterized protein LOC110857826 [Folsomia candida]